MAKDSVHQAGERAFEEAAEGRQEPDPATDTGLSYEEADRVWELIRDMGAVSPFTDRPMVSHVWIDASGLGAGVYDKLNKRRRRGSDGTYIKEYKGAKSPKEDERYRRLRDEAFWVLRDRLEEGEIALPDDEEMFQELLAIRYRLDGQGRVALERKKDLRKYLGRSPDKADAVAMAFHRDGVGVMSAEEMITKW